MLARDLPKIFQGFFFLIIQDFTDDSNFDGILKRIFSGFFRIFAIPPVFWDFSYGFFWGIFQDFYGSLQFWWHFERDFSDPSNFRAFWNEFLKDSFSFHGVSKRLWRIIWVFQDFRDPPQIFWYFKNEFWRILGSSHFDGIIEGIFEGFFGIFQNFWDSFTFWRHLEENFYGKDFSGFLGLFQFWWVFQIFWRFFEGFLKDSIWSTVGFDRFIIEWIR